MVESKFHQEIHQATIETNFSIGVTRKHLTSQLEKLIETKNGKLFSKWLPPCVVRGTLAD